MADIWDLFKQIGKKNEVSGPPEFIVAGLGNPGTEYDRTRHNTGFMAIDRVAESAHIKIDRLKFKSRHRKDNQKLSKEEMEQLKLLEKQDEGTKLD